MRIGLFVGPWKSLDEVIDRGETWAKEGFSTIWFNQIMAADALTLAALVGRLVPGIEVGTAVVPIQPRHAVAMAQQALTVQSASGGRFVLGIGLSHQVVIEHAYGLPFDAPLRQMREYLAVLGSLIKEGRASFTGRTISAQAELAVPGASPCAILVAALGPKMLELAGRAADGTITWMTGPATLERHISPSIREAAKKADRPPPRIVAGLPVVVTDDLDGARERAARSFARYGQLPSYRAMLDREGAEGPADVAIIGDEKSVTAQIDRFANGGATDFLAQEFGSEEERARTHALLMSLL
jgi:F420-dependent oxidoreductase-like protein